jgi:hypothetical protein
MALGYLAVENWIFGFERVVDLRLKPVNIASRELLRAEREHSALLERRKLMTTSSSEKRDELRRGIDQRDASIAELTGQPSKEAEFHQRNLEAIREACRIIRDTCMVPRSQAEDRRYAAEVSRLSGELALQREERKRLQSQISNHVLPVHLSSKIAPIFRIAEVLLAATTVKHSRCGCCCCCC